jgi:hypothetical protein
MQNNSGRVKEHCGALALAKRLKQAQGNSAVITIGQPCAVARPAGGVQ